MTLLSTYSPLNGRGQRRAAAVALCAGALTIVAGCSSGPAKPLSARAAIGLAADETQHVNSMAATFSAQVNGSVSETTTGTIRMQIKPALLLDETVDVSAAGQSFPMDEIVTTKAAYLKSTLFSALTEQSGKPWLEIPFSDLSGNLGSSLTNLLQSVQNGDPLTQTKMLAASKNVHSVGTQVIDGVRTTHYTGSFTASAALAALPASLRTLLAPLMKSVTGDISFNVWIDAQHVARRVTEVETVMGETVNVTMNVTAVNQPVHIALPSASQVTTPPSGVLGGA